MDENTPIASTFVKKQKSIKYLLRKAFYLSKDTFRLYTKERQQYLIDHQLGKELDKFGTIKYLVDLPIEIINETAEKILVSTFSNPYMTDKEKYQYLKYDHPAIYVMEAYQHLAINQECRMRREFSINYYAASPNNKKKNHASIMARQKHWYSQIENLADHCDQITIQAQKTIYLQIMQASMNKNAKTFLYMQSLTNDKIAKEIDATIQNYLLNPPKDFALWTPGIAVQKTLQRMHHHYSLTNPEKVNRTRLSQLKTFLGYKLNENETIAHA